MQSVRTLVLAVNDRGGWSVLALSLGLLLVGSLLPVAQAGHIGCGAILEPGAVVTLDADVGPCDYGTGDAAIIVRSTAAAPTILDLGGFTVSCPGVTPSPVGIWVQGERAKVSNGKVSGCADGVFVEGTGKHTLEKLTVEGNGQSGLYLSVSPSAPNEGNKLAHNTATQNGYGFLIYSEKNTLIGNTASSNRIGGFTIIAGENRLVGNTAVNNPCTIPTCECAGFHISGNKNTLVGNTADSNFGSGFQIRDVYCGFQAGGHHTLFRNTATNNGGVGIEVFHFNTNNRIVGNTATGNEDGDLADYNEDCDDNRWARNTFDTPSPSGCIR